MKNRHPLDCVTIGYNDPPFEVYAGLLAHSGTDSEAYQDLQMSFVDIDGRKLTYLELLNLVSRLAGSSVLRDDYASGEIPNLAAVYLVNFLRRRGWRAEYVNLFQREKDRLAELLDQQPACVAITTTFYVMNFPVHEMVEFIREHDPDLPIVIGGPLVSNHVRNYPQREDLTAALRDLGADYYVIESQGEATLAALIECLRTRGDVAGVPNLAYFADGGLHCTPSEPERNDMDENSIDWRHFEGQPLGQTLQTRTARSCAFNCSFCNYPTRAGKLSLASLDAITRELDSMATLGGVGNVVFIDDTFNVPLPRFKDLCRLMIERDYGFRWFSYFRCSNADEEAIELMARSGCTGVFLGIESGSPRILDNMNKHAQAEQYREKMKLLHDAGIVTFASFITGFPGETAETVQETLDFIRDTKPDFWRSQLWYCESGTPITRRREEFDLEGEGFVWSHTTMESMEAVDHIRRMFLSVDESTWLPQWSFDFWVIPYLLGEGVSIDLFRQLMAQARDLLALEIAHVPPGQKSELQREHLDGLVATVRSAEPTAGEVVLP